MAIKKPAIVGFEANSGTPASLLLHFNGTNGSAAFTDSSPNSFSVSAGGNAQISTVQSKWGGSSAYFDGAASSFLTVPASADFSYDTQDFTIECWIYGTDLSNWRVIYAQSESGSNYCVLGAENGLVQFLFNYQNPGAYVYGSTISANMWHHIAVCRKDGVATVYVDGVGGVPTPCNFNFNNTTFTPQVGSYGHNTSYNFAGYVDDLRVTKGLAVYAGNFIPPQGVLAPYAKPEPVATQASLLLHFDGDFADSSENNSTFTSHGQLATSTDQSKFGGSSGYFDGSSYLTAPFDDQFVFGTGDFTVEGWIYWNQASQGPLIAAGAGFNGPGPWHVWALNPRADQNLVYWSRINEQAEAGMFYIECPYSFSTNKWYHVAASRFKGTTRVFVNGTEIGSAPDDTDYSVVGGSNDNSIHIGYWFTGLGYQYHNGYIDEIRVAKGVAVYTKNFAPPIAPPDPIVRQGEVSSVPASLLLRFEGENNSTSFKDSSVNALALTANGNAKISTEQSKWGGSSGYFDGNSSVALGATGATLHGSAEDFTIECWVWPEQFSISSTTIFGTRPVAPFEDNCLIVALDASGQPFVHTNATVLLTGGSVAAQQWTHLALTRQGNTFSLFANGVLLNQATGSFVLASSETALLGWEPRGERGKFYGYIDDFRIVKGLALYAENFTPPTAPVAAVVRPPEGEPASLLLHFDGPSGSTNFKDSSPNALTVTQNGTAQISTTQSKWGGSSGYFDGNSYVTIAQSSAVNFANDDFTIEFWLYPETQTKTWPTIFGSPSWGVPDAFAIRYDLATMDNLPNAITIQSYSAPGFLYLTSGPICPPGSWYHVALVRNGLADSLFINGVVVAKYTHTTQPNWPNLSAAANTFVSSSWDGADSYFNGYIDDFRIVKGLAVYTDTFVPPTAPLSPYAKPAEPAPQASLLLHFDGNFNDSSSNALTVTAYGDATVSPTQKRFGGSSLYVPETGGGALIPFHEDFNFGSGDFTVECWYYPLSITQNAQLVQGLPTCSSTNEWFMQLNAENSSPSVRFGIGRHCVGLVASAEVSVSLNEWHHFAVSRKAGVVRAFKDGMMIASVNDAAPFNVGGSDLLIGEYLPTTNTYSDTPHGYIDDVRITKGFAAYTGNFIPSEEPLSPIVKPKPVESQSSLLLHFEGADGVATFKDSGVNALTVTANGDAVISASQGKFGGASGYFDGDGDYLLINSSPEVELGSENFTIELWYYALTTSSTPYPSLISKGEQGSTSADAWTVEFDGSGLLSVYIWAVGAVLGSNQPMPLNVWTHVALVRDGSTLSLFINGQLEDQLTNFTANIASNPNGPVVIGCGWYDRSARFFNGYIDDLRIVKGMAVYTGPFIPPNKPLTGIASPKPTEVQAALLLHFGGPNGSSTFKDSSPNGISLTANNVVISSENKFGGSSGYFNGGAVSTLTTADVPAFGFGTGDFTIEMFVKQQNATRNSVLSIGTYQDGILWRLTPGVPDSLYLAISAPGGNYWDWDAKSVPINVWSHIALTRQSGTLRAFVDGVKVFEQTGVTVDLGASRPLTIGCGAHELSSTDAYYGHIDELRIIKGYAAYADPFTPPKRPWNPIESVYEEVLGPVPGCVDPSAINYNPSANSNDGSCQYAVYGCTDFSACNYNPSATIDDFTCQYAYDTGSYACVGSPGWCQISTNVIYDPCTGNYSGGTNYTFDGSCYDGCVFGCKDTLAANYDPSAEIDDGSCCYSGCTDPAATNYNPAACGDDGSCTY